MKKLISKKQKGISLFVAVLVASVALLFSFAISDIALREVLLSQTGKDSQEAFYAANSGIECALFHDLKEQAFMPGNHLINCNDNSRNAIVNDNGDTWDLVIPLAFPLFGGSDVTDPCFVIDTVSKDIEEENGQVVSIVTEIIVKGYNTCDTSSPRRLERALRVEY